MFSSGIYIEEHAYRIDHILIFRLYFFKFHLLYRGLKEKLYNFRIMLNTFILHISKYTYISVIFLLLSYFRSLITFLFLPFLSSFFFLHFQILYLYKVPKRHHKVSFTIGLHGAKKVERV